MNISGGSGPDLIYGGTKNDRLFGSGGDDTIIETPETTHSEAAMESIPSATPQPCRRSPSIWLPGQPAGRG